MTSCHHCLRPVPVRVQPVLPQGQRLKEGRAACLSAQAGHCVLLQSWVPSWHCQHNALRARGMCSALRRPQRQPSPTSAFIGMAREPCLAARGLPAQLVRVMRASTTLPMCSRRLRSAAARDISISVICRKTATAPTAPAGLHGLGGGTGGHLLLGTPAPGDTGPASGQHAPASSVGAVSHPRFGTCHSLPGVPPLLTISSRSSFLMVTFASSFSLEEEMDKPPVTKGPRWPLPRCSLGHEAGRSDPSQHCGAGRGPGGQTGKQMPWVVSRVVKSCKTGTAPERRQTVTSPAWLSAPGTSDLRSPT